MASLSQIELSKLDDFYSSKFDLERVPHYIVYRPMIAGRFKDLVEETITGLARSAHQQTLGKDPHFAIDQLFDMRRRWSGPGTLEFQGNSSCMSCIDGIIYNQLNRMSKYYNRLLCSLFPFSFK